MKSNAEAPESNFDGLKWAVVVLLIAAAVAGNLYFSEYPLLYRTVAIVVVGVVGVGMEEHLELGVLAAL